MERLWEQTIASQAVEIQRLNNELKDANRREQMWFNQYIEGKKKPAELKEDPNE